MRMTSSFTCPNCSAPLDVGNNHAATIRCPYCSTSVIIPEELRGLKLGEPGTATSPAEIPAVIQADINEKLTFIREMALAGNKLVAVKALRELYVIGLKPAAEAVDAMQRGEPVDLSQLKPLGHPSALSASIDPAEMQRILKCIRSGDKIEAIKLFRQATGVGLKEAKTVIDEMEASVSATKWDYRAETTTVLPDRSPINQVGSSSKSILTGGRCLLTGFVVFIVLVTIIPILIGLASPGGPLAGVWARVNPFASGRVILAFGKAGTGPGYFADARYVAVDHNGHIFVGEFNGGRVQVFDENGKYLTQWKAKGEETEDIYLAGMAAGRNGTVYAVIGSQLYAYDGMNGQLLGRLDHPDGWGINDVTVAPDGSVIAAWYKNRDDLVRFSPDGQVSLLVENAITNVTNDSELSMKVAVDGLGNIYTLASFNEAVFIFSSEGKYISRFGSQGDAEGQFTSPRAIAIDNLGKIYIADFAGVMIYASDGRYLDTLRVNGAVMGMVFDEENNLLLIADEQVLKYRLK